MSAVYVVVYGLAAWCGLALIVAAIFHLAKRHHSGDRS